MKDIGIEVVLLVEGSGRTESFGVRVKPGDTLHIRADKRGHIVAESVVDAGGNVRDDAFPPVEITNAVRTYRGPASTMSRQ